MEKHHHTPHHTRRESLRKYYQIWEGKNILLCRGKLMFGASLQPVIYTLMLINVPTLLQEILIIRLFDDGLFVGILIPYIILHVLANFFMMQTILTDPGIIRRYNEKYVDHEDIAKIPQRKIQALAKRNPCDITFNNNLMRFKYCRTCHIYRPLRTTHCHECDNCVERFDHHCPWLGCCIGKRNYRNFFMFVLMTTILVIFSIFISLYRMLSHWKDVNPDDFGQFLKKEPYTIISLVYCALFSLFLVPLLVFHIWLVKNNMTTNEFWKKTWKSRDNPYKKKNIASNCMTIMCLPIRASFIQFKSIVYPNRPKQDHETSGFAKIEMKHPVTQEDRARASPDHLLERKESDKSNTPTNFAQSKEEIQANGGSTDKTPPSSAGNPIGEANMFNSPETLSKLGGARNVNVNNFVFNMKGEPIEIVARGSQHNSEAKGSIKLNYDLENEKSPLSGIGGSGPLDQRKNRRHSGSVYDSPEVYSRNNSGRKGLPEF